MDVPAAAVWRIRWDVPKAWVDVSISQEGNGNWSLDASGQDSEEYVRPPAKYRIRIDGREGAPERECGSSLPKSWSGG